MKFGFNLPRDFRENVKNVDGRQNLGDLEERSKNDLEPMQQNIYIYSTGIIRVMG